MVERRFERITGHRATIGSVSLTLRLDLVAHDVRIAGAPPFESQTLARADRVTLRLGGPGGFWSPSEIAIDGLDIEYLGTSAGDNLRGVRGRKKRGDPAVTSGSRTLPPLIRATRVRLHGSVALPHAPPFAFRVPQVDFQRDPDGKLQATLHHAVIDAQNLGSLRLADMTLDYSRERLTLASKGDVSLDVAGGGTFLAGLDLVAAVRGSEVTFELGTGDSPRTRVVVAAHSNVKTLELKVDADDVELRPLGALLTQRLVGLENAKATLHASTSVDRASLQAEFSLEAKARGVDLLHPAVDTVPWRDQAGSLSLRGSADLATGRIDVASGSIKLLAATLLIRGWLEISRTPRGSLELGTPRHAPLSCAALLAGQAAPVKKVLSGLDVDGRLGFTTALEFDAADWEDMKLDVAVTPICRVRKETAAFANLLPLLLQSTAPVRSATDLPLGPFHPDFVPLANMPMHLTGAFLTSEDSKFFHHHGFDLDMIRRALAQDLENRSFQRGASTITQQLAKNLFLTQRRTLARKLEEAVLTWRLQKLVSKERVLEMYLNVIELGPGIRGIKQAARAYFGKDVAALTPLESAHLAALTPNPRALARRFRDGKVDEGWQQRLYDLLGMMKRHGRLSAADLTAARSSKLDLRELVPR